MWSSQALLPAPLPFTPIHPWCQKSTLSKEGIHTHRMMLNLLPPQDQRQESHNTSSFSQHPEVSLNSAGHLRHCISHPWQGPERGDRLTVQSQPPTH